MSSSATVKTRANQDRGWTYVDPQYMRDLAQYVKLGQFKISNDKYKYSTNNIILPFSFNIDDIFLNNDTSNIKINSEDLRRTQQAILANRDKGDKRNGDLPFYYRKFHEFMVLDDFLEFYHKYLAKRKEESEKQRYKIKFSNEVEKIKQLKTAKFIETETLKLGGQLSTEQRDNLDRKILQFQSGLNYAIEKLNYHQAQKMLRKLNTVPQPPMRLALGKRTRLYSFKTGANLNKALNEIIEEPGIIENHPELQAYQDYLDHQRVQNASLSQSSKLGEKLKKEVQYKISNSVKAIDKILQNGPNKRRRFLLTRPTTNQQTKLEHNEESSFNHGNVREQEREYNQPDMISQSQSFLIKNRPVSALPTNRSMRPTSTATKRSMATLSTVHGTQTSVIQ